VGGALIEETNSGRGLWDEKEKARAETIFNT
jgi:hypothetical protein